MASKKRYKGYSLRNRIFLGFLLICLLSMFGTGLLSYFILKDHLDEENRTELQRGSDEIMGAFDYALSHSEIHTRDIPQLLGNKIMEISDINKQDLVVFDLNGNFLLSNRDADPNSQKNVPNTVITQLLNTGKRVDIQSYDAKTQSNITSSYMLMKNNMLEPIAVLYLPYYHNDSKYMDFFDKYLKFIVLVGLVIILLSMWISWQISKNLTNTLTNFSSRIRRLTLFNESIDPIPYYHNDELGALVKAYNKMILQIQDQKDRLAQVQKEAAWKEMAKQVAHEVKNPLTPMRLRIQNFERKFDPQDPEISTKVHELSKAVIEQIDLIATVATAFSQFAQLPARHDETFSLNAEVKNILQIFNDDKIYIHANKEIEMKMDKIYLNRIITNLVTNAKQAKSEDRDIIINVDLEQNNKRITLSIVDNGVGIPEEMYDKIFEPNFTSKSSGMGLGLTMVKRMIQDYHGEIQVSSVVGKGTKFTITMPSNL
ncbi:sensor histidine kinase [Amniculibacterium aquaticum]|uniref:sensor histidine kinase n=1 Tax=Amniculibacterium aquaticum TaxID=2479858 RepID=UPI000F5AF420|nr:ATP-binding protein [Amniculibacterium aquaticum]